MLTTGSVYWILTVTFCTVIKCCRLANRFSAPSPRCWLNHKHFDGWLDSDYKPMISLLPPISPPSFLFPFPSHSLSLTTSVVATQITDTVSRFTAPCLLTDRTSLGLAFPPLFVLQRRCNCQPVFSLKKFLFFLEFGCVYMCTKMISVMRLHSQQVLTIAIGLLKLQLSKFYEMLFIFIL